MKKNIIEISLATALVIICITGAFATETQQNISDKLIRLHVIANSDSDADQALKLKVRDEILKYVSTLTKDCDTIDDARKLINNNLTSLEDVADRVISDNGFNYSSKAELKHSYFPTKIYDSFSLPAGKYEALSVKLGNASGQNWWCVLFPPVCISAAETELEFEKAGLSDEEINFVTSDKVEYRFKFKIVEFIENFTNTLQNGI